jgi:hypothetical protein
VPIRKPLTAWLPDIQVAVLRDDTDSGKGLILGAKGGHNAESHNHNDVGNFLLMLDGQPGIVDIGTAVYTRETFGPARYSIWYIRASAHNAPVVNGVEQRNGRDFAARDVSFEEADGVSVLRLDIAGAYPEEAGLASLYRSFRFDRGEHTLTVTDAAQFQIPGGRLDYTFYSQAEPTLAGDSVSIGLSPRPLLMTGDGLAWSLTARELDDPQMRSTWGDRLWAIAASTASETASCHVRLVFTPGP